MWYKLFQVWKTYTICSAVSRYVVCWMCVWRKCEHTCVCVLVCALWSKNAYSYINTMKKADIYIYIYIYIYISSCIRLCIEKDCMHPFVHISVCIYIQQRSMRWLYTPCMHHFHGARADHVCIHSHTCSNAQCSGHTRDVHTAFPRCNAQVICVYTNTHIKMHSLVVTHATCIPHFQDVTPQLCVCV